MSKDNNDKTRLSGTSDPKPTTPTSVADATVVNDGFDAPTEVTEQPIDNRLNPRATQVLKALPADVVVIKSRFVLEERLGKGGMGQVYKARDLRKEEALDDNPWVAIKFLGDDFSRHPKALISLQREAKKSQQLAHPNVVTVYDFDRDGDRVYMTMEFLEGAPLSRWDSLDLPGERVDIVRSFIEQIAAGLSYAHQHGVVHSDLKPDNVFVTLEGRVKILDFGIARIAESAVEKDSFDAGELGALTLKYASLEMLRGGNDPHPADDVYALGLIAHQLYTGEHPFGGQTAEQALDAGLSAPLIKTIPRSEAKAIQGALAFCQRDRIQSAEQFLKVHQGRPARNRLLIAAVAVLTVLSIGFGYRAMQTEGPAVPFESLSAEVQAEFSRNLDLGHKSADIQDWDGAARYFMTAYDLHPRNAQAEEGLNRLADHLVALAPGLASDRQRAYLLEMIQSYSSNEYLSNHGGLNELRQRLASETTSP